ncbi:hypothetical protein K649_00540 [Meiothermus ruber DSM 1279]|uniref:Uncharacterized protein n=1 Tax=Meiothermus ruber (strain ATCC 35948 / DSM 1279 / VKM B-1258 / 21) TaxID=504728 RepID=M9X5H8_MEIRD|nr:hypothetical protein K649_00540 [Meiothermus ruber DSM 1279]
MNIYQQKAAWRMLSDIRIGLRLYTGLEPHTSTRHRIHSGYRLALNRARQLVALLESLEKEHAWQNLAEN